MHARRVRKEARVKISIFGLGYVGAVSLACLARDGHSVIGVDIDQAKLDLIRAGKTPVVEEGMVDLMAQRGRERPGARHHRCRSSAVLDSELSLICVGTPSAPNGSQDQSAILKLAHELGRAMRGKTGEPCLRVPLDAGAGHGRGRAAAHPRAGIRQAGRRGFPRLLPARVPARRHVDPGLRQAALHGGRRERRGGGREAARAVRPPAVRVPRRPRSARRKW